MRTDILHRGYGVLKVTATFLAKNAGTTMYVSFPVDTLFDWYPLNTHYSYKYSEKHDLYYLVVDSEGLDYPRYGVSDNKGAVNKNKSHMEKSLLQGKPLWYNEAVSNHNKEVFSFARSMGIKTPDEDFNQEDVTEGLALFQKGLDVMYDMALTRFTMTGNQPSVEVTNTSDNEDSEAEPLYEYKPNELKHLGGKDEETRACVVLAELSDDEEALYGRLGEVYTMLALMQKIITAKG